MLLGVYFALAAATSFLHLRGATVVAGQPQHEVRDDNLAVPLDGAPLGPVCLARLCQVLLSTVAAAGLMLDVVLWSILMPSDTDPQKKEELNWSSYNMHALNLLLIFVEIAVNSIPLHFGDIVLALLWPLLYCHFTLLRVGMRSSTQGCLTFHEKTTCSTVPGVKVVWPYFFLDTSREHAWLWYLGLSALFCLAYAVIFCFARCCRRALEA